MDSSWSLPSTSNSHWGISSSRNTHQLNGQILTTETMGEREGERESTILLDISSKSLYHCSCFWMPLRCWLTRSNVTTPPSSHGRRISIVHSYVITIISLHTYSGDRYDGVRVCLGEQVLQKLAKLKLFMVRRKLFKFINKSMLLIILGWLWCHRM